jgi:hypothetical protein
MTTQAALVLSDTFVDEAHETWGRVRRRLDVLDVPGELVLTGAASVPGALSKGDVDLHLRVPRDAFAAVVDRLRTVYEPGSVSAWAATLAVFDVPGARSTGLAVTPVDSEHDVRFCRAWDVLRADPGLLEEYNDLKRKAFGTPSYEDLKSAFFSRIIVREPPAGREGADGCGSR